MLEAKFAVNVKTVCGGMCVVKKHGRVDGVPTRRRKRDLWAWRSDVDLQP